SACDPSPPPLRWRRCHVFFSDHHTSQNQEYSMDALERAQALAETQGRVGLLKQDTHWHNEAGCLVELAAMSTIRLLEIRSELERYAFELAADTLVEDCSPRDDGLPTGEELVGALTGQWVIDLTPE